jgi:hypothetical protein
VLVILLCAGIFLFIRVIEIWRKHEVLVYKLSPEISGVEKWQAEEIFHSGGYLYLNISTEGSTIKGYRTLLSSSIDAGGTVLIDITDPRNPGLISYLHKNRCIKYAKIGSYLAGYNLDYLPKNEIRFKLSLWDSYIPDTGSLISILDLPEKVLCMDVINDALIIAGDDYISSIDYSLPSLPRISGILDLTGEVKEIEILDQKAYVLVHDARKVSLTVIDFSDLVNPRQIFTIECKPYSGNLEIENQKIFLREEGQVAIYSIAETGEISLINPASGIRASNFQIIDDMCYAISEYDRILNIFNIEDSNNVRLIGSLKVRGLPRLVHVVDHNAYIFGDTMELSIDISNPEKPRRSKSASILKFLKNDVQKELKSVLYHR